MSRAALGTANRAAAMATAVARVELLQLQFSGGVLRLASGDRDISYGGNVYFANGSLGDLPAAEETIDLKPRTVTLKLSGANAALISTLRTTVWQYSRVDGWLGFLDAAGNLVADPYSIAPDLRASSALIALGEGTAEITLEVEGRELALLRNSAVLATDVSQRARYPGDTGMSKVAAIADIQVQWGGKTQNVGTPSPVPGRSGGLYR